MNLLIIAKLPKIFKFYGIVSTLFSIISLPLMIQKFDLQFRVLFLQQLFCITASSTTCSATGSALISKYCGGLLGYVSNLPICGKNPLNVKQCFI